MNNDKIREHTKPDAIIADEQIDEANVFEYPWGHKNWTIKVKTAENCASP